MLELLYKKPKKIKLKKWDYISTQFMLIYIWIKKHKNIFINTYIHIYITYIYVVTSKKNI